MATHGDGLHAATSPVSVAPSRRLADVFDNEAIWDAEDTDAYILTMCAELETALQVPMIAMKDAGGNSLLHMAAIWKRPKVMEALIRKGIELNDKNVSDQTPLDLATHYGNVDLALQLRHYGGKHTCESDRDLAVAQRDLAQRQWQDVENDLTAALASLKAAKQEREELRVERDRLAISNDSLVVQRDAVTSEKTSLEQELAAMTSQNQHHLLQVVQLREELLCESDARLNAVQSWHNAQQVITELQERELAFREREEEVVRMRDEALQDRDVACEVARLAQLDQGLSKQAQLDAERERDSAVHRLLDAEEFLASEKKLWSKRIAKTERDRKNIQIEIDRQTETLRKECDRLEKQLRTATTLTWTQREEITEKDGVVARLEARVLHLTDCNHSLTQAKKQLEGLVASLEEAQRSEHKAWRARLEQALRDSAAEEMRRVIGEVMVTSEKLQTTHQAIRALDNRLKKQLLLEPELTMSLYSGNHPSPSASTSLSPSLSSSSLPSATVLGTQRPPTILPFLLDRPNSSNDHMASTSSPSLVPNDAGTSTDLEATNTKKEVSFHTEFTPDMDAIDAVISTARSALLLDLDQLDWATVGSLVVSSSHAVCRFLDAVATFVSFNWRHFEKQVHALEKMVSRKDELIDRFNQHRRDKPKKPPARLRECLYKPEIL